MTDTSTDETCGADPGPHELPTPPPKWSAPLTEQHEASRPDTSPSARCQDCGEPPAMDGMCSCVREQITGTRSASTAAIHAATRQAEINAAETARVEALLQVCRWAANTGATDPLAHEYDDGYHHITIICAIQHDRIEETARRLVVMTWALKIMAERWHELPVDGRAVIMAGLLAGQTREQGWAGPGGMQAEIMSAATSQQRATRAQALAIEMLGL